MITLCTGNPAGSDSLAGCYRLADELLSVDRLFAPLDFLRADAGSVAAGRRDRSGPRTLPVSSSTGARYVSRLSGWLAGATRTVEVFSSNDDLTIVVDGVGTFLVSAAGDLVVIHELCRLLPTRQLLEVLLGPPLTLALARHDVFCLHASAARWGETCIAFAGESGRGKSTMARYLGRQAAWQRLTDDIAPTRLDSTGLRLLPHFPQMKIRADRQPAADAPRSAPLSALYLIGPPDPDVDDIVVTPLSSSTSMTAVIRHTVAARLFDRPLLTRHLDYAAQAAPHLRVKRLTYPRRMDILPHVQAVLEDDLRRDWGA